MVEEPPTPNTEADTVTDELLSCGTRKGAKPRRRESHERTGNCASQGAAQGVVCGVGVGVGRGWPGAGRAAGNLGHGTSLRDTHLQVCILLCRHGGHDADQASRVHLREDGVPWAQAWPAALKQHPNAIQQGSRGQRNLSPPTGWAAGQRRWRLMAPTWGLIKSCYTEGVAACWGAHLVDVVRAKGRN